MAPGQDEAGLTDGDGEMPTTLTGARLRYFQWSIAWAKLGREWFRIMELSPHLEKHVRKQIRQMRAELAWVRTELEKLGLQPPKGTA